MASLCQNACFGIDKRATRRNQTITHMYVFMYNVRYILFGVLYVCLFLPLLS